MTTPPTVVSVEVKAPPKFRVIHRHFKPWARPTYRQIRLAIHVEAHKWGASEATLVRRLHCESGGHNLGPNSAGAMGCFQFMRETFYRGFSTIKTRVVRFKTKRRKRLVRSTTTTYSDGTVVVARKHFTAHRTYLWHGVITRHPDPMHGYAQIRIAAQANAGRSAVADSEWVCR